MGMEGCHLILRQDTKRLDQIMKLCLCLAVVFHQLGHSFSALRTEIYNNVWGAPFDMLKLCVPSLLYTIQNNLLYLALSNLGGLSSGNSIVSERHLHTENYLRTLSQRKRCRDVSDIISIENIDNCTLQCYDAWA